MDSKKVKRKSSARILFLVINCLILFESPDIFPQQDKYKFDKLKANEDISSWRNTYKLDRLTTNDKNFSNAFTCVVKDKKGFIWFGTHDGINRFDGSKIKLYSPENNKDGNINNYFITSICDDDNCLWIGTSNGLNRFDKTTEQFKLFKFNSNYNSPRSSNWVQVIFITKKRDLWIGTSEGLFIFDRNTEKFTLYKNNSNDSSQTDGSTVILSLYEDKEDFLWIGTYGGLYQYDIRKKEFTHYKHNSNDVFSLSNNMITDIVEINKDIWIATQGGGINKFDKKTQRFYSFQQDSLNEFSISENAIIAMSKDENQKLWLGFESGGIGIFDPLKNSFHNLNNNVYDASTNSKLYIPDQFSEIYTDDKGIVWLCSRTGFIMYNKNKRKFNQYGNTDENNIASSNWIYSFCEDDKGNVWVGSSDGIDILNKEKERINHLTNNSKDPFSISNKEVVYIFRDKKNFMWIGSIKGPLERYDPETGQIKHFYDYDNEGFNIFSIFEDKEENLWVGLGNKGLRVFDKNRELKKKYLSNADIFMGMIYRIFEDNQGFIWLATSNGLVMLEPETERITFYKNNPNDSNSLNDNYLIGIAEDKKGYLWVIGEGGLNRFDPRTKNFKHYDGLPTNKVQGILQDTAGNFWLSVYKGISMFNPSKESFTNYDMGDGVQGLLFTLNSFYKAKDGEMYFGGINGFNSFYPDSIPRNKNIPAIVLTDFRIFNKEVKLDTSITEKKVITISYKENFFSFDFASLDYTNPSKNQHAYILEGVDKDWNYVGNTRTANYTDIASGEYTFRVKGSNNDGVWNEEGVSLKLIITPPWYETIWFKGLAAISLLGGIGFIFGQRIKKIRKVKRQQEEFTKKLINSQENERKRVASELHDSLGQNLIIIKNKALISIKKTDDPKFKEQMNEISELTTSTLNEVREISYNLRPYELDRLGLLKTLQSLVDRASKSTNIKFICDIDNIDKVFAPEIEINIYRIIQECLSNIIKHSEATEVIVHIKKLEKEISIFISDNGKGFNVEKKFLDSERKGFGLRGIPERVKLFGGEFDIESEPVKGTRIKIIMPFRS